MPVQAKFKRGWYGVELPGHRDAGFTYGRFAYDSLPPLEETLDGGLGWLKPLDGVARRAMEPHGGATRETSAWSRRLPCAHPKRWSTPHLRAKASSSDS